MLRKLFQPFLALPPHSPAVFPLTLCDDSAVHTKQLEFKNLIHLPLQTSTVADIREEREKRTAPTQHEMLVHRKGTCFLPFLFPSSLPHPASTQLSCPASVWHATPPPNTFNAVPRL